MIKSSMSVVKKIKNIRTPKTRLPIMPVFKKRFSPRVFSQKTISTQDLKIILEAARLTPSAKNNQPWFFYIASSKSQSYKKIIESLPERNAIWAKTAPTIVVACYDPLEPTGDKNKWAIYDLGAAVVSLIYQAQKLGYYCRQIGIFESKKIKKILPLNKSFIPFTLIVLGKIGNEKDYKQADPEIIKKELTKNSKKTKIFKLLP